MRTISRWVNRWSGLFAIMALLCSPGASIGQNQAMRIDPNVVGKYVTGEFYPSLQSVTAADSLNPDYALVVLRADGTYQTRWTETKETLDGVRATRMIVNGRWRMRTGPYQALYDDLCLEPTGGTMSCGIFFRLEAANHAWRGLIFHRVDWIPDTPRTSGQRP